MATPSSAYTVDTTTTLANGTELKWTKQIKTIYPNLNDNLDRSCTYSEMSSPVFSKSGYGFKQNLLTDQYAPAYGANIANSRWAKGFLRTDGWTKNVWYGTVLVDMTANSSNVRRYFFGYTDSSGSIINGVNGGNARILRDIKVNKLLFNVTIKGYKISDYNSIDYTANPFSSQAPSEVTIKLSELDAHPNDYIVTMIYYGNTMVYGPNGAQKWLGSNISPAFICYSSDVGGFHWIPFAVPTPAFSYSYQTQNGHPNWTGGTGASIPFNLAYNYVFGCDNSNMKFELPDTFAHIDASLQALALAQYGYDSNWNHPVYFNKKIHNFGDFRCIELNYGYVSHSGGNPGSTVTTSAQTNLMLGITGDAANKMIAGLGLYFCDGDEDFNPNDENITPDTMYTSQHIWLGEMSAHGITTGRWVKGSDIENYTGPNKNGDINDPDYTPGSGGGGSEADDLDPMDTGFASTLSGCTKYFLMSPQDVNNLIVDFYTNAFAGSTLSQSIISCYLCGAEPSEFLSTENSQIKIPTVSGQAMFESTRADYQLIDAVLNEIPMGSIDVPRLNGDFHDFSPYTIYEVFLPFCGWCSLPDTVAGRKIIARLEVDIRTMAGKGIILMSDDDGDYATVAEMCANIGASAPFAVIEAGLERQAAVTAGIQTAVGVAQGLNGAVSGHNALTISGFGNAIQGVANGMMSSMANYTQVQGKAGDTSDFANGRQPYLKISWAKTDDVVKTTQFAHAFGYVCDAVGTLGNFSGFTVVSNPHIKINATQAEREEIKRLLEEGVVL